MADLADLAIGQHSIVLRVACRAWTPDPRHECLFGNWGKSIWFVHPTLLAASAQTLAAFSHSLPRLYPVSRLENKQLVRKQTK